ncbi:MAG: single-stranded DNA-binding protein [Gallionella sp.]|jgi:single-strand DNA-binding protein
MANDLNQCEFIGRLGKDPESRYMPNGDAVTSFSLAVGSTWKDKNSGEKKESTEWVNVTAFGKLGEIISKYCLKGSQIWLQGRMKTDKYQDKDTGADRYSTKIIADKMQLLGSKSGEGAAPVPHQEIQRPAQQTSGFDDSGFEDVPF